MKYYKLTTIIGSLHLYADDRHLRGIFFDSNHHLAASFKTTPGPNKILKKAIKQLKEYFKGTRKSFDLPLAISGSEFQKKAWVNLTAIKYGTTVSYAQQAKLMKCKSYRAVGTANGKNLFPIIIPCHRVINKSGKLGGYSGGLSTKQKLLDLEQAN